MESSNEANEEEKDVVASFNAVADTDNINFISEVRQNGYLDGNIFIKEENKKDEDKVEMFEKQRNPDHNHHLYHSNIGLFFLLFYFNYLFYVFYRFISINLFDILYTYFISINMLLFIP